MIGPFCIRLTIILGSIKYEFENFLQLHKSRSAPPFQNEARGIIVPVDHHYRWCKVELVPRIWIIMADNDNEDDQPQEMLESSPTEPTTDNNIKIFLRVKPSKKVLMYEYAWLCRTRIAVLVVHPEEKSHIWINVNDRALDFSRGKKKTMSCSTTFPKMSRLVWSTTPGQSMMYLTINRL